MATVADFIRQWRDATDYIVAHTSGSTGEPKEIRLLKSDMAASARATNAFFGITGSSVIGLPLSVDYIAGKMAVVRSLLVGCRLLELPVSNDLHIESRIDLLSVVPSQVDSLISDPRLADKVGAVIVGGAALSPARREALVATGVRAFASYGMTETCSHVALCDMADGNDGYRAMPGITFSVDARGCLVVEAPAFSFRRLVTNDIVTLVDSSSFTWRGRYDNVINSGGIKFAAEELERLYSPFITEPFYVTSVPDDKWGEAIAVVVEGDTSSADAMLAVLRDNIGHRRCPKKIIAVDSLERTSNGKIKRKKIV